MCIVGLTGTFATGKSTVARMFERLGARLIDADVIAHKLLRSDKSVKTGIMKSFGAEVMSGTRIDRAKLARRVFSDKRALQRLCALTHPKVIRDIKTQIAAHRRSGRGVLVVDAPLLYEGSIGGLFDTVIVVSASRQKQIERARAGRKLSEYQIRQRIKAQFPLSIKKRMADFVIDNNGTKVHTNKQVRGVWNTLRKGAQ